MPSPNVSSLFKFEEVPIGHHSGIPDISVPIYEIKDGNLSLPISLKYHTGSTKPSDQPTVVGLGWSMHAGGVITRDIKGLPDEEFLGYYNNKTDYFGTSGSFNDDYADFLNDRFFNQQSDCSPDLFYFNFNGYTGKFMLDENNNLFVSPYSDIKIEFIDEDPIIKIFDPEANCYLLEDMFEGFRIITPDGTKYEFTEP